MNATEIAKAWHSVADEWIVRRNKMNGAGQQWEVVHDWGGELVSEDTQKIIAKYPTEELAKRRAKRSEDYARGTAVLATLPTSNQTVKP